MAAHTHHHGAHPHGSHEHGSGSGRRLAWGIALNLTITVAQVIGGLISGSLALLSDALHNFGDTASLGVSWGARRIAQRSPNAQKTFGYQRAEIIGAFVNLVTLVLIALFLIKEAVERFVDPRPVDGMVMLVVAAIGLAANVATAFLLHRDASESLNVKSAYIHIISDALASVGVVVGGVLVLVYDLYIVDPIITVAVAVYILVHSYQMLRQTIDILMESAPPDLDLDEVVKAVQALDRVLDMHHVHAWQLDQHHVALEAHIVIDERDLGKMEAIKERIKARLSERFGIGHSTLEFELVPCDKPHLDCFGHDHPTAPDEPMPATERGAL